MIRTSVTVWSLSLAALCASGIAFAAPQEEKEAPRPYKGVISATGDAGDRNTVIDTDVAAEIGDKENVNPISGSVSKAGQREWKMVVANNSQDPYSVDLKVEQYGKRGNVIKTDNYTYRLKAGERAERILSAAPAAGDARLKLTNFRNLAPKKKAAEGEAAAGVTAVTK